MYIYIYIYIYIYVGDLFVTVVTALSKNIQLLFHHRFQHFVEFPVMVVPNPKVHHPQNRKGIIIAACDVCINVYEYIFRSNGSDVTSSVQDVNICVRNTRGGEVEGDIGLNTHCNVHYNTHCYTHCNTLCNIHCSALCNIHCYTHCNTLCNIHCNTLCNIHCNIHCNTHCKTYCNTHCNTHCNALQHTL